MSKKFIIVPIPKIDESLMGFIIRLAHDNNYEKISWIYDVMNLKDVGQSLQINANLLPPEKISGLASLTGIQIDNLIGMSYYNNGNDNQFNFFNFEVSKKYVGTRKVKLCPYCLTEELYIRKIWDLNIITSCPIHRCILIDKCQRCNNNIPWYRSIVNVCKCGNDLRNASTKKVEITDVMLENHIYDMCNLIPNNNKSLDNKFMGPLKKTNLNHLIKIINLISWYLPEKPDHWTQLSGRTSLDNDILHKYYLNARMVFEDWPNNFMNFLHNVMLSGKENSWSIQKTFGHLYKVIRLENEYEPIRHVFNSFLDQNWENGYLRTIAINRLTKNDRTNLTGTEAKEVLKVTSTNQIRQLIQNREIFGVIKRRGERNIILVNRSSLYKYKNKIDRQNALKVGLNEVKSMLGISHSSILKLSSKQLITAIHGPQIDGNRTWLFSKQSIINLVQKIEGKCETKQISVENLISFSHYIRIGAVYGSDICDSIERLVRGCIRAYKLPFGNGLNQFYFNRIEVNMLYPKYLIGKSNYLDYKEISMRLKVKENCLHTWFKNGFIPYETGRFGKRLVKDSDFKLFQEKYITIGEIAKIKNDFFYRGIYNKLKAQGIEAVSGPKIDGGVQYLFLREDLMEFMKS